MPKYEMNLSANFRQLEEGMPHGHSRETFTGVSAYHSRNIQFDSLTEIENWLALLVQFVEVSATKGKAK